MHVVPRINKSKSKSDHGPYPYPWILPNDFKSVKSSNSLKFTSE